MTPVEIRDLIARLRAVPGSTRREAADHLEALARDRDLTAAENKELLEENMRLDARLAALTTPQEGDARERLAEVVCLALNHRDGGQECEADFVVADAVLATFPLSSRDIAGEIDAEREDTDFDALGAEAYINGLTRAAEIVRNGR